MKTTRILVLTLFAIFVVLTASSQVKFINYTCPNNVKCIEVDGDIFWAGTTGGLYKWHKNGTLLAKYDIQNGLIGNNVNCLKMDYVSGGLWIGTTHGVSKLVGSTWTSYTESDGLVDNDVQVISIDPLGHQWFGTNYGVSEFDGVSWTTYDVSDGLAGEFVSSITFDSQGNKWFGTMGYGLSKFDGTTWTTYTTGNGLAGDYVYSIVVDLSGNKWLGTDGGVSEFDGTTWTTYNTGNGLAGQYVRSVAIDPSGIKWFGTDSGVSKFDGTTWTTYTTANGLTSDYINSIIVDASNNKWFGAWFGVSKFDGTNWTQYVTGMGLKDNNVKAIAIDNSGIKWFGTAEGVSKFDGTNWTAYTTSNGLADNSVSAIAVDASNNKWFGTWSGISKFDGTTWTTYTSANGLAGNNVKSLVFDNQGNLWAGTWQGLSKFDGTTWTNYHISDGLISDNIKVVKTDSHNNIWIGAWGGISKFDGTTWTSYTTSNSNLPGDDIRDIAIDTLGNMWSVSWGNCASMFNGSNFIYFSTLSNYTHAITADSLGNIWIGSDAGLTKYDGFNQDTYTVSDGLVGVPVSLIAIDSQNNKWIGTWNGASKEYCEAPVPEFTSGIACVNQSIAFTNQTTKNNVFTKYQWDINNDGTVEYTTMDISHTFTAPGSYQVKLSASNETCSSSVIKTVKVNSYPVVTILPQGSTNLCEGSTVVLHASVANIQTGNTYTYLWSNDGNTSSITVDTTGVYNVTVTNENCSASATTPVNAFVQSPYQNEQICIVTVDTIVWKNKIIWNKTSGVGTEKFYIYKEAAAGIFNWIGESPEANPTNFIDVSSNPESHSDRYKISVVDSCNHESAKSMYHNTMNLVVSVFGSTMGLVWTHYQTEDNSYSPDLYYIYKGTAPETMQLLTTVSGNQNTYNDNNVFDLNYYMIGVQRDCNNNSAYSNYKSNGLVGIQQEYVTGTIKIFPNPMTTSATLTIPNLKSEIQNPKSETGTHSDFVLRISDLTGKIVRVESPSSIHREPQDDSWQIERGDLKPGVYFVELNAERVYRGKLVVE